MELQTRGLFQTARNDDELSRIFFMKVYLAWSFMNYDKILFGLTLKSFELKQKQLLIPLILFPFSYDGLRMVLDKLMHQSTALINIPRHKCIRSLASARRSPEISFFVSTWVCVHEMNNNTLARAHVTQTVVLVACSAHGAPKKMDSVTSPIWRRLDGHRLVAITHWSFLADALDWEHHRKSAFLVRCPLASSAADQRSWCGLRGTDLASFLKVSSCRGYW